MFMPTVKKNRPSSRPLNGATVASIALRYSVSASMSPATKAPSAIDSPAWLAITPAAMMTNSAAAIRSSFEPPVATRRNSGRSIVRPNATMTKMAMAACNSALARLAKHRAAAPRRQDGDEQQDRYHGKILRQQHGEAGAADAGGQTLLVGQEFEHDRGRGQRQARAQHDRLRRTAAGERRGAGDERAGQEHLRAAEAEHQPAHRREPLKRQFEADEKQEKDDTQFGDAGNVAGVADRDPEQGGHAHD